MRSPSGCLNIALAFAVLFVVMLVARIVESILTTIERIVLFFENHAITLIIIGVVGFLVWNYINNNRNNNRFPPRRNLPQKFDDYEDYDG